jgi:serine-type D-Ala-D-Ala carboxypeptidase (penicillin-binding protein 5/6)
MNGCSAGAVGGWWAAHRRCARTTTALLVLAATLLWLVQPVLAARSRGRAAKPATTQAEPRTKASVGPATPSWIVVHAVTGEELASQDPDRVGAPASMTKMMLALVVMEAVKEGQLTMADPVPTSRLASKMGGSQVYLKEGESFSVEEMLAGLLIGSANDAAAALAERLTGSVEATIQRMNDRAGALKLTKTRFGSVHGLPPSPGQPGDVTTPRDMARLGQELLKYPEILRWTGAPEAPFRGGSFILRNSNKLIGKFPGADGIKTGHFAEAGYNVAVTAKRGNLRLIAVVMGAPTNQARFTEAARLLGEGFNRFTEVGVVKAGAPVGSELRIARAKGPFRPLAQNDVQVLIKREEKDALKTSLEIQPDLKAPLPKGQVVGALIVRVGEREVARTPVVTAGEVARKTFWWLTPWK